MGTPYKMKSSPAKGRLGDFFKGIGSKRRARKDEESFQKNIEANNKAAKARAAAENATKAKTAADNKEKSRKPVKKNELPKGTGSNNPSYNVDTKPNAARVSANKSVGVKKTNKVDHNKGLKGKHGAERRRYYDKHKLKYDKTISFGPDLKKKKK